MRHGDSEWLKPFYDIHDDSHSSHLEDLHQANLCGGLLTMVHPSSVCLSVTFHIFIISIRMISVSRMEQNLVEGMEAAWRFRIAKMVPF